MDSKNYELHFLNRDKLAEQGIDVPEIQPYSFAEDCVPTVNDEMRNGLAVKTSVGSPVFTINSVSETEKDGTSVTIIELKFDRIDPTPYSKVPKDN